MSIFQNWTIWQHSKGYPGSVGGWKKGLRGLFNPVRLGQVMIAKKSSIIEPLGSPIHSLACFGRIFERTVFERTTYPESHNKGFKVKINECWKIPAQVLKNCYFRREVIVFLFVCSKIFASVKPDFDIFVTSDFSLSG